MRRTLLVVILGLSGAAQSPQIPAASAPAVWVVSSLTRVLPGDPPGPQTTAHLFAARGEYQAFQIALRAPASGLTLQNAQASDLTSGSGHSLSRSGITLYREHYVHVDTGSPDWRGSNRPLGPGSYPDALIPFLDPHTGAPLSGSAYRAAPFTVAPHGTLTVWVDVRVDRGASPGDYTGEVTLSTDQGDLRVAWTLTVWNFELPLKPTLKSSFAFWNPVGQDALEELVRHKLMPGVSTGNPAATELALMSASGLSIANTGLWSGADTSNCMMGPAPSVSSFLSAAAKHAPQLDLFNYTADEIGNCTNLFPQVQAWARNMHAAGIKNLVVIPPTPALYDDGSGTGRSAVDIWVILPMQYNASSVAQVQAKGDEVWSYNAVVQDGYSPKWQIDYDLIDYRIQAGFISQSLGLTGLLYWRVDLWSGDPWSNVNNTGALAAANYPGEGLLMYPGQAVGLSGVVPSMRLKALRDGVQDYEYVAILKGLGRADWALPLVRSVAPDWRNWARIGDQLEAARRRMGAEIDRLSQIGLVPRRR
jgi:hypothetical protein